MSATLALRHLRSRTCAVLLFLLVCAAAPPCARGEPPASGAEVRERRLFRAEDPFWRRLLALPAAVPLLLGWPLKHALIWAERTDLPDRLSDAVHHPFGHRGEDQEE